MSVSIRALLDKKARLTAEMQTVLREAEENPDAGVLSADQAAAFSAMKIAMEQLEASLMARATMDDMERRAPGRVIGADKNFEVATRAFNISRAIAGAAGLGVDDGYEREISRELCKRRGRPVEGIMIPFAAFHRPIERRVLSPAGSGAGLVGTFLDESQYIDALRAALVIARLGARYLTGLDTQVDLPALTATATATWVADGSAVPTDTTESFGKVSLRPHTLGGIVEMTRNQLLTSTPAVQDASRNDLVQVLARGIDSAAIGGTGAPQPIGILNQAGLTVISNGTNGGPLTYANVLATAEAVEVANAPTDSLAFLGNSKVTAQAKQTLRVPYVSGGGFSGFLLDLPPNTIAQFPYLSTNLVPSNGTKGTGTGLSSLIFGDWSELLIGLWGEGVEVLVNPYGSTQFAAGSVQVRALVTADVQVRHVASFAAMTDLACP